LNQDVENLARIIDAPPRQAELAIDHQTEFIEAPSWIIETEIQARIPSLHTQEEAAAARG
jgi:hypothetical protein